MSGRTRLVVLALAIVLIQPFAHANGWASTLRVPEDHETIEAALGATVYGDTVDIAVGTYYEHDLIWPPGVAILGRGRSPESLIIDAQYQGRVMRGDDLVSDNELAYITLCRGDAQGSCGSGLRVQGDPHIHNVIIEYCESGIGDGIGLLMDGNGDGAILEDCILRYNKTESELCWGGGARILGRVSVRSVEVYGNHARHGAGLWVDYRLGTFENLNVHDNAGTGMTLYSDSWGAPGPYVENSVFYDNTGPGIAFRGSGVISNCTFVGNGTVDNDWSGALYSFATWEDYYNDPVIRDCVIAYNNGPGIRWYEPTPYTIECNNVYGNKGGNYLALPDLTGQDGNISADPKFCDGQSTGVYGIQSGSPCAPDNNECGALMGAFPVSCEDTATENISWSRIKSLY